MPIIIALMLRRLVMASVSGVLAATAQNILDGGFKALLFEIKDKEGVTEQDAWDILRKILGDVAVQTGVSYASLGLKLPVKTAEMLGLTSKGIATKALSSKAGQVMTKLAKDGGKNIVKGSLPNWIKIAGIPASGIWLVSAIANIVEPGIYKPEQTNAVYKALGIPFQYPTQSASEKPGPFSADSSVTFADYYKSLEASGVKGINNTFAQQSQILTKQNLADLVNAVYGTMVTEGKSPSVKELIPKIAPYLIGGSAGSVSSTPSQSGGTSTSNVKVFTGIVSQGVVGQGLVFTPRPDDLIESVSELREAAANNLAPFLASLPGKVVYEVKVVSSITTKDGFKQTGTVQKVKTGTFADGSPKYKTVVNKFATLVLFIITERNTRTKLATIVLGPVDSTKLQVGQNDLRALETQLPSLVTTQDVNEIKGIETANPITVTTPPVATVVQPTQSVPEEVDTGFRYYSFTVNGEEYLEVLPWLGNIPTGHTMLSQKEFLDREFKMLAENPTRWKPFFDQMHKQNPNAFNGGGSGYYIKDGVPYQISNAIVAGTNPSVNNTGGMANKPGAGATTLSDWYQAQGQSLPPVSARSVEYERLGLGPSNYYTGTSEQNTKLLNALKSA